MLIGDEEMKWFAAGRELWTSAINRDPHDDDIAEAAAYFFSVYDVRGGARLLRARIGDPADSDALARYVSYCAFVDEAGLDARHELAADAVSVALASLTPESIAREEELSTSTIDCAKAAGARHVARLLQAVHTILEQAPRIPLADESGPAVATLLALARGDVAEAGAVMSALIPSAATAWLYAVMLDELLAVGGPSAVLPVLRLWATHTLAPALPVVAWEAMLSAGRLEDVHREIRALRRPPPP